MDSRQFRRLSEFYFFYFAVLGAFVPYRSRYFDGQGFDSFTIGLTASVISLTTIAAPYGWAAIADRFHAGHRVLLSGVILSLIAVVIGLESRTAALMILAMAMYSLCWNAILPQAETLTLGLTEKGGGNYSRIRLWGSIGYMLAVVGVGYGVEWWGVKIVEPVVIAFMLVLLISAWVLPRSEQQERNMLRHDRLREHFWQRPVIIFLFAAILVTISHAPYYTFFDLYMRKLGYTPSQSGWLITLGVIAEIGLFMIAQSIIQRWRFGLILHLALIICALRWIMLATLGDWLPVLLLVQVLHAVTFALMHTLAMHFVHNKFPPKQRGRAQAIYSALTYGVGGAAGNFIAGAIWDSGRGGAATFMMSGVVCALAFVVVYFLWRRGDSAAPKPPPVDQA